MASLPDREQIAALTPVVIWVLETPGGRVSYVSRNVATLLGYTRDEIEQMDDPVSALWHPDDARRYRDNLLRWKSLADGEIFELEYRICRRDGEWRWLSGRVMPFSRNAQGEVCQVVTATLDVTGRKEAEAALRDSRERFRNCFELGLTGMAITSPEKGCIAVNDEICRILGYERSELLSKTWADMTHPDDLAADVAQFERVLAGEFDGYSLDKRWIRKDGQVIDSTVAVKCVRREDGSIEYVVASLQDVTARKRTEEALARSRFDLEQRVKERTAQLTVVNEELNAQIMERTRAEMESRALKDALAEDLAAMTRLHEFSARLLASTELQPLLEEILNAIMSIQEADFGLIQSYNPETGALDIVVQRGFQQDYLDYQTQERDEAASFVRALKQRRRVIIKDVQTDPAYAPRRRVAATAGFRAIQSTPLFGRRGEPLAIVSIYFRQPLRPSERALRLTDLYASHAAELFERKQAETAVLQYQQELRALTARLIDAQETENKYLARELHDDFSQKLAVLGMETAELAHETASQALGDRLLKLTGRIGDLAKDIHQISRHLHPAILDDLGLEAALKNECAAFSEKYGLRAEFYTHDLPKNVPEGISLCLYRLAQECLTNVFKHANATEVRVSLRGGDEEIVMEIADVGVGFDLETIRGKGVLGLISMEERVRLVNGVFSIRSETGVGTVVRIQVPLIITRR